MSYREMLKEYAGYSDEFIATMNDEDCEHEWIEVSTDPANYEVAH